MDGCTPYLYSVKCTLKLFMLYAAVQPVSRLWRHGLCSAAQIWQLISNYPNKCAESFTVVANQTPSSLFSIQLRTIAMAPIIFDSHCEISSVAEQALMVKTSYVKREGGQPFLVEISNTGTEALDYVSIPSIYETPLHVLTNLLCSDSEMKISIQSLQILGLFDNSQTSRALHASTDLNGED